MRWTLIPLLLLLTSCAGIIGGVAGVTGGAAAIEGANIESVQTVALRSRYNTDCSSIHEKLDEFIKKNEDIKTNIKGSMNVCEEIKSSDERFRGCQKNDPQNLFKILDGNSWTGYDFYMFEIQKNADTCDLLLYTRLDFELKGNPFSPKSRCQNGFDSSCEEKFEKAKIKRDKIISNIQERSQIALGKVKEERIFNYYFNEKALRAFLEK